MGKEGCFSGVFKLPVERSPLKIPRQLNFDEVPLSSNTSRLVFWKKGFTGNLLKVGEGRKIEAKNGMVASSSKDP
eukprot:c45405_g1_i1 orf=35-259(+)